MENGGKQDREKELIKKKFNHNNLVHFAPKMWIKEVFKKHGKMRFT